MDIVTLALARKYAEKLACGVAGSSYDSTTSTMTVNLNDGNSFKVTFDDGITTQDRETLDDISYNSANSKLEINGVAVLTHDDVETENIDFSNMF